MSTALNGPGERVAVAKALANTKRLQRALLNHTSASSSLIARLASWSIACGL